MGKFVASSNEAKKLLLHALMNQLETDFQDQDYDAMDEFITQLMRNEDNHTIVYSYLTDTAQKNWEEGKTKCRF